MDLYARFDLPPPPPPTVFSQDHTFERARMPNFTSVEEVSQFVDNSIVWRHSKGADAFIIFSIIYIISIVTTLSLFIGHRLYNRAWWVFRLVPRGHSTAVIPNVHNAWTLFIGLFALLLLGSFISNHIGTIRNEPIPNNGMWIGMMWAPIVFAAWYQTWGIVAARFTTGSATPDNIPGHSLVQLLPPWLVNVICICFPGLPVVAALAPSIIGNAFFERARHGWKSWHHDFDGASELTRDMILDAQTIFHSSIHGAYYMCVAMVIWAITCFIFCGLHAYASTSFILDLREHLIFKRNKAPSQTSAKLAKSFATNSSTLKASQESKEPSKSTIQWQETDRQDSEPNLGKGYVSRRNDEAHSHIRSQMFTARETAQNRSYSFFPPIAPSKTITRLENSTAEKVVYYFAIQSVSVMLGCLAFIIDIIVMIVQSYPAAEANHYEHAEIASYIAVSATSFTSGTTSSISVTHATFEASFAALLHARRAKQGNFEDDEETAFNDLELQ
ncbi:hypothetical protein A4X13_0g7636 [Tilletia indica]|uniref:Uncharacterized protein n=1 Tax=Tilletia indica TaxID=43049 RepID=A0A8T8SI45_9BASI|nr:hypothetical protein A4X13_0g7636 [Tilletia indica]